jgi:hypothetical protein
MHRIAAMLLMAVLGLPGMGLGVFADAAAQLPACCRRAGKHHCASTGETTPGPALQSARCPSFPVPQSTLPQVAASFSAVHPFLFGLLGAERASSLAPVVLAHSSLRTEPQRGPPSA